MEVGTFCTVVIFKLITQDTALSGVYFKIHIFIYWYSAVWITIT